MKISGRSKKRGEGFIQAKRELPRCQGVHCGYRGNSLAQISHLTIPAGSGQPTHAAVRRPGRGRIRCRCFTQAPHRRRLGYEPYRAVRSGADNCHPATFRTSRQNTLPWGAAADSGPLPAFTFFGIDPGLSSLLFFRQVSFSNAGTLRYAQTCMMKRSWALRSTQPNKE
jgi:hypothetical protein